MAEIGEAMNVCERSVLAPGPDSGRCGIQKKSIVILPEARLVVGIIDREVGRAFAWLRMRHSLQRCCRDALPSWVSRSLEADDNLEW